MNYHNQFVPISMPFPMMPWSGPASHCSDHHNEVPARVKVAMSFLNDLSTKTMSRAAVNDMSIEIIPGQNLSEKEQGAMNAACHLLVDYFEGNLDYDVRERAEIEERQRTTDDMTNGVLISCVSCRSGPVRKDCILCRGTGQLLVIPPNGGEDQP